MNLEPMLHLPTMQHRMVFTGSNSENRLRYIAQSILQGVVDKPELPTSQEARDIIAWASQKPNI